MGWMDGQRRRMAWSSALRLCGLARARALRSKLKKFQHAARPTATVRVRLSVFGVLRPHASFFGCPFQFPRVSLNFQFGIAFLSP